MPSPEFVCPIRKAKSRGLNDYSMLIRRKLIIRQIETGGNASLTETAVWAAVTVLLISVYSCMDGPRTSAPQPCFSLDRSPCSAGRLYTSRT